MATLLRLLPVALLILVLFASESTARTFATNAEPVHTVDEGAGNAAGGDAVLFDGDTIGTVWHVHHNQPASEDVQYSTSGDGGHTWEDPVQVPSPYTFNSFPNIEYANENIFVFFSARNDVNAAGQVVYSASGDDGETWSDPQPLGMIDRFSQLEVVSTADNINVAWCCDPSDVNAVLVQSTDGGDTWSSPFLFGPASEAPRLAAEDASHTWAIVQTQNPAVDFDNLKVYRWENGADPALEHSVPTYPYHSWIKLGATPSGGGAPPLYVYYQTLYTPSTVLIERLDSTDGDAWHDPVETEISYTVGDPQLGVGPDYLVFSYTPTSQTQDFEVRNIISQDGGMTWSQPKRVSPAGLDSNVPTVYVAGQRIINAYSTISGTGANAVFGAGLSASADRNANVSSVSLPADNSLGARLIPLEDSASHVQSTSEPLVAAPPFILHWLPLNETTTSQYGVAFAPGAVTGDATCDNSVTGADLLSTLGEAAGVSEAPCKAGADANCDNSVDVDDALRIVASLASLPRDPPTNCMPVDV